jgi:hypothetical protein
MTAEAQRREQDRKTLRGNGRIVLTPASVLEVRMLDVSTRGVAAVSSANLLVGSTCVLEFSIPDGARRELFKVPATVVATVFSAGVSGFRLGLRFDGRVDAEMTVAIERYVAS